MIRLTIVSIPAQRQAVRIVSLYLNILLTTIIQIMIVVLIHMNLGLANMFRSVGIS